MKASIERTKRRPVWAPIVGLAAIAATHGIGCGGDESPFDSEGPTGAYVEEAPSGTERPELPDASADAESWEDRQEPPAGYSRVCEGEPNLGCWQEAVIGTWRGSVFRADAPTYTIEITFRADGTYEARCPSFGDSGPGLCLEDADSPTERAYILTFFGPGGAASGRIESPVQDGWSYLTDLRLSQDETRLIFQLWSPWTGEEVRPTTYKLTRIFSRDP